MKRITMATCVLCLSTLSLGVGISPAMAEEDELEALLEEEPEKWSSRRPPIDLNLRFGVGLGYLFYENDSDSQTKFDAAGIQAFLTFGDTFLDRVGYSASVRATNLTFLRTIVDDIPRKYESDERFGFALDGAAGLELWVIPRVFNVSFQGAYSSLTYQFAPRNVLTGPNESRSFLGFPAARVIMMYSKQDEHRGVNVGLEFQRNFAVEDPEDQSTWTGTQTMFTLSFSL